MPEFDRVQHRAHPSRVFSLRRFLGCVFRLPSGEDGGLRSLMDVRLVADLPVLVAWPVVPSQCEPRPPRREIDDPARVAQAVLKALSLIDQEAEFPIVFSGCRCLKDPLPMDRVHARLLGPACPWVGHLLGQAAKLAEFVFGVASDHGFRCGLRVDQYSRPSTGMARSGSPAFPTHGAT